MRRRSVLPAVLAILLVAAGLPGDASSATPGSPGPSASSAAQPAGAHSVTLVTGDRVRVRMTPGGQPMAEVEPARRPDGSMPQFHVSVRDEELHVLPSDVRPLVPRMLDPELFNVTSLVRQGFDDASSASIPVIAVRSGRAASTLQIPAAQRSRELASIGAVAVTLDKPGATELGSALHRVAGAIARTGKDSSELSAAEAGSLVGVTRIWLDRRVQVRLDRSTGQIGAPAAWQAGLDGSGVRVAVLDTGIDERHPDLSGQVVTARNFTEEPDTRDRHGHGTHVASTVAGTGAASGGSRRGVASGADLVSGKVLDAEGFGLTSWVIAGMEWAATEMDADIVNLSLGLPVNSPDGALMDQAVDQLTADHDALFVVAAGNSGCDECVQSPSSAASALSVGAVDRDDRLASFSSRGPVPGTRALKPDITAPGVGIVAARAEDAALGGEGDYLQISGTSMATPHVAGAAALLAQARPELGPSALKAALMSTAAPSADLTAYQQGAGRVDVRALVGSPVLAATGSVDFGYFPFPQAGHEPVRRTVGYRNVSDKPVTLRLAAELDGPVTVRPAELTVPPGESASAELTLDVAASSPGRFSGRLVAELPDGTRLRTPVGFVVQAEQHVLKVTGVARDGRPATPVVTAVVNVEDGTATTLGLCENEQSAAAQVVTSCATVPKGTYSVVGMVSTYPSWQQDPGDINVSPPLHTSLVGDPQVRLDKDTTVVLDARKATEVKVDVRGDQAVTNHGGAVQLTHARIPERGQTFTDMVVNFPGAQLEERLFIQPMSVSIGDLATTSRWRLEAPDVTMTVLGHGKPQDLQPRYYRRDWFSGNSRQFPRIDGRADLAVVDAGAGRPEDIARARMRGALALIRRTDALSVAEQSNRAAAAGARMVAIYNDRPGVNANPGGAATTALRVPTVRLSHAEGLALLQRSAHGRVTVRVDGTPASPFVYDLVYAERGSVPNRLHYVADKRQLVQVDRSFHSQDSETATFSESTHARFPWELYTIATDHPVLGAPRTRTDYHVYHPDVSWSYLVSAPERPYNFGWPDAPTDFVDLTMSNVTYRAGERAQQAWLRQPLAAGANPSYPLRRAGDMLRLSGGLGAPISQQAIGLVDGRHLFAPVTTTPEGNGFTTRFQLHRGDETITDTPHAPGGEDGAVKLPTGERQTYRMTFEVQNQAPWARLSTRTRTEWTFGSARTASPETVALLTLGYDLDLDLRNRLGSRRQGVNPVGIRVGRLGGAAATVSELRFAVSYDDGIRWHDVQVRQAAQGRYLIDLPERPPRDARYVSFRVRATGADGDRVEQEIIRAVAIASP